MSIAWRLQAIRATGAPGMTGACQMRGRRDFADIAREGVAHPAGIWPCEECTEITLHSDKYDQAITILHYGRDSARSFHSDEPPEADMFDRYSPQVTVSNNADRMEQGLQRTQMRPWSRPVRS